MDVFERINSLPDLPGVYIMKNRKGDIIYVGKGRSLKKRVRTYIQRAGTVSGKTSALMSNVTDIEYVVTPNEKEALLIEYALIKKYRPRYNVEYRDDKTYPFIKLTVSEEFPRILITRQLKKDGSKYYGPYTDGSSLRSTIHVIKKIFPLRSCRSAKLPYKECLDYHIRRCPGPCIGQTDVSGYRSVVREIQLFLEGSHEKLLHMLKAKMLAEVKSLKYEKAVVIRNQIFALKKITDRIHFHNIDKEDIFKQILELKVRRKAILDLQIDLGLKSVPRRIEAFDVSCIQGKQAVGSLIVFSNGEPDKKNYRRFKIKLVQKVDDYGMIKEIVGRRYHCLKREKSILPDLVLIDGGRGQLNAARSVLEELGLSELPVIGLAKRYEHIFVPGRKKAVVLQKDSHGLHLIQHIRDEAHRFALSYHRYLRRRDIKK